MSILCSELKFSIVGTHDAEFSRENRHLPNPTHNLVNKTDETLPKTGVVKLVQI